MTDIFLFCLNTMFQINMKRLDLLNKVREIGLKSKKLDSDLSEFVLSNLDCGREDVDLKSLKINVKLFISKVTQKYVKSSRHFDRLLKNESKWLSVEFVLKLKGREKHSGTGRPKKSWDESGERTKSGRPICRRARASSSGSR